MNLHFARSWLPQADPSVAFAEAGDTPVHFFADSGSGLRRRNLFPQMG